MAVIMDGNEVQKYKCDGCGVTGYSRVYGGLPDGWFRDECGILGFGTGNYCPRCTAKREAKEAEKEAERKAEKKAAREAQAAYDATPDGKKERNIAALSAVAAVLLFFLFAGVFHLYFVAFIIGFLAGAPFFWFRARKAGFIFLVFVLLMIMVEINGPDVKKDEANANASQTSEEASTENSQAEVTLEKAMTEILPAMKSYAKKIEDFKAKCPNGSCYRLPYWKTIGFKAPKSQSFNFRDGTGVGDNDWQLGIYAKEDVLGISCHWIIRCISTGGVRMDNCICNVSEDCKDISPNLKSVCEVEYDEF